MGIDAGVRLRAAQGYAELGMVAAAWRELAAVGDDVQRRLDPDALQTEIVLLIKEGRWNEGLERSRHLCKLSPESLVGFIHGAFCLHELGETEEAHDLLRSGPAALRKEAVYHYNLACYRAVMGRAEKARQSLARAIAIDPQFRHSAKSDPDLKGLNDDSGLA